jgi:hypothetical protein
VLRPGDIVILDNLGSHTGRVVRNAFRKAAERTVEKRWNRIGILLDTFSQQECQTISKTQDMRKI